MTSLKYKHFFSINIQRHYPYEFEALITSIENHYQNISTDTLFAAASKNPIDNRLDFCSYFLALIKTLDEKGESFETIRKICLEIVIEYVRPKNKFQEILKRLPAKIISTWVGSWLAKSFHKKISTNNNQEGFIANIITDKKETYGLGYGIDIIECGICKLFKKHDYYKYASILCEVDEVTSSLAGLQLIRTGTIANGAKKCDFRFKKVNT